MATFKGRLWLVPDRLGEVRVEIQLDDERIKITAGPTVIGDWALADINLEYKDNDVHLHAEGEELVIWSTDPEFAPTLFGPDVVPKVDLAEDYDMSGRGAHLAGRRRRRARPH